MRPDAVVEVERDRPSTSPEADTVDGPCHVMVSPGIVTTTRLCSSAVGLSASISPRKPYGLHVTGSRGERHLVRLGAPGADEPGVGEVPPVHVQHEGDPRPLATSPANATRREPTEGSGTAMPAGRTTFDGPQVKKLVKADSHPSSSASVHRGSEGVETVGRTA